MPTKELRCPNFRPEDFPDGKQADHILELHQVTYEINNGNHKVDENDMNMLKELLNSELNRQPLTPEENRDKYKHIKKAMNTRGVSNNEDQRKYLNQSLDACKKLSDEAKKMNASQTVHNLFTRIQKTIGD